MGVRSCLEARHFWLHSSQEKKNTRSIEIFPSLSVIGKGCRIQQLHALHCTTTSFCFCAWYKTGLPCHDSQLYCHSCYMHLQWYWWAPFRGAWMDWYFSTRSQSQLSGGQCTRRSTAAHCLCHPTLENGNTMHENGNTMHTSFSPFTSCLGAKWD